MTRLRSLPQQWNDAAMRRIAMRFESRSSWWPLVGMLALGLVAGAAIGGYAVSQRSQLKRLSRYARHMAGGLGDGEGNEAEPESAVTVPFSNHRRKAAKEV